MSSFQNLLGSKACNLLLEEIVNSFYFWKWDENDPSAKRITQVYESDFESVLGWKRPKEKAKEIERSKKNDFESILKENEFQSVLSKSYLVQKYVICFWKKPLKIFTFESEMKTIWIKKDNRGLWKWLWISSRRKKIKENPKKEKELRKAILNQFWKGNEF